MIKLYKEFIEIKHMIIISKNLSDSKFIDFSKDFTYCNTYITNNDFITLKDKKFLERVKIKFKLILQIIKL